MPTREQLFSGATKYLTLAGMILPIVYFVPIMLAEISSYFGRLHFLIILGDVALLLSLPWELVATVLIVLRWRDLPQRFWIIFCINAYLVYTALPAYRVLISLYA